MDDGRSSRFSAFTSPVMAQYNGLVDMSHSKEAKMVNMPLGSTRWTGGFWGDRFKVFSETSLWDMWKTWDTPEMSHGFRNFEIAAGDAEGEHWGPPFMMVICINGLRHVLLFMQ